jgi:hypothetical protein
MAPLKDITLEAGLTDATNGFDSTQGTCALDTTSKIKGVNSMRCDAVGDFGREDVTASDSLFVSAYVNFVSLPGTTQTRILFIRNGTTALCGLRITSTGLVQLRDAAGTQIGASSGTAITTGNPFRIGLHYTKGTGANAVLEAFVASGDTAFSAAFASTSADTGTLQANRIEIGQGASGTVCDVYVDDVKIDDASMPGASVASGMLFIPTGANSGLSLLTGGMRG